MAEDNPMLSMRLDELQRVVAALEEKYRVWTLARGEQAVARPQAQLTRDDDADMFRYRLGQGVRWAEYPHERYWIAQRRWTQREVLAPVVEYRLRLSKAKGSMIGWVYETDLEAWEE